MAAFSELVLLLLVFAQGSGDFQNDLVSYLDPADYFKSRRIEAQPKALVELASKPAPGAEATAPQLLAIRWLGDNEDQLGGQKDAARRALQKHAEGPDGFAKDYARRALAKMDGKPAPTLHTLPKDSARKLAIEWFPEDIGIAASIDARPAVNQPAPTDKDRAIAKQVRTLYEQGLKMLPAEVTEAVYNFADVVGNVRIDRVSIGYAPGAMRGQGRIYMRFSGLVQHQRLADFISSKLDNARTDPKKGAAGELITVIAHANPPAFALIGDGEMLMCGHEGNQGGNEELIDHVLAVRAGKKKGVLQGALAKDLQGVPEGVAGMAVGAVPDELQRDLARPFGAVPKQIVAWVTNNRLGGSGVELHAQGTMGGADEAAKFADMAKEQIKQGIAALDMLPPVVKPEWKDAIKKTMEGIEVKADGAKVMAKAKVSPETQLAALHLLEAFVRLQQKP